MKIQGKKLVTKKNSKGFTLLELTISLFLLLILSLLLTLILQTTIKTSRNFLDFTNYEYALAHKKILEIYNDSSKVERESNFVMMTNKDKKEDVKLVFQGDRVYIAKQKSKDFYAGYILLLKKLKSYSIEQNGDIYSCDHYVYPEYKLGNLIETPLVTLVDNIKQKHFGSAKSFLSGRCKSCKFRFACHGGCPKHRTVQAL